MSATFCIHVPMLDVNVPENIRRNAVLCMAERKVPGVGADVGEGDSSPSLTGSPDGSSSEYFDPRTTVTRTDYGVGPARPIELVGWAVV